MKEERGRMKDATPSLAVVGHCSSRGSTRRSGLGCSRSLLTRRVISMVPRRPCAPQSQSVRSVSFEPRVGPTDGLSRPSLPSRRATDDRRRQATDDGRRRATDDDGRRATDDGRRTTMGDERRRATDDNGRRKTTGDDGRRATDDDGRRTTDDVGRRTMTTATSSLRPWLAHLGARRPRRARRRLAAAARRAADQRGGGLDDPIGRYS